ncbi:hypothetical protein [Sorangium sp. So ce176]|uniref:hypothetical protein n=1 Tax=Sorangium sp. So ce176 TaxID=3133286 RepID=UPI003F5F68EE
MLSNAARFLMVSAAASLVVLGSAPAEACSDVAEAALDLIEAETPVSNGAPFFTRAMRDQSGYTGTDIAVLWGSTSPNSHIYYDNIVAENYFERVTNVADIAAGDLLAIDQVVNSSGTVTYSGHAAIITGPATQLPTALSPIYASTKQYVLPIADATSSVHGCNVSYPDSRWSGACTGGTFTTGPGTASMRLYTDLSGNLLGYTWSVTSGAAYYSPSTRPYAIGKLTSCLPFSE